MGGTVKKEFQSLIIRSNNVTYHFFNQKNKGLLFQSLIIRSNNVTPCLFYILFINNLQVQISFFKKKPKKLTHIFQNYALIDIIK